MSTRFAAAGEVVPVVELRGCGRTFPGPVPVTALHPTSLTIESGDFVAIVGPSGSGKSTLLHLLGLLDAPTEGSYLLDGQDTSGLTDWDRSHLRGSRLGFVFQQFHLLPHRTVLENVMLAQLYNRTPRRDRLGLAQEALAQVGMSHRAESRPPTLSGGEQQRVAIARALINKPALMLCDEPTGNLDSTNTEIVLDLLEGLNAEGYTIVVITHDDAVAARAQRIVEIQDGELRSCAHTS